MKYRCNKCHKVTQSGYDLTVWRNKLWCSNCYFKTRYPKPKEDLAPTGIDWADKIDTSIFIFCFIAPILIIIYFALNTMVWTAAASSCMSPLDTGIAFISGLSGINFWLAWLFLTCVIFIGFWIMKQPHCPY